MVELAKQDTSRAVTRDVQTGRTDLAFRWNAGSDTLYPHGMRVVFDNEAIYWIVEGDPLSAEVTGFQDITYRRDESGWKVRILARGRMSCDRDAFLLEHWLTTWENDRPVHERTWSRSIPRDQG